MSHNLSVYRPVCERGDNKPTRIAEVLITILELCVSLSYHTVINILKSKHKKNKSETGIQC